MYKVAFSTPQSTSMGSLRPIDHYKSSIIDIGITAKPWTPHVISKPLLQYVTTLYVIKQSSPKHY
jgi:hypothetical protein